MYQLRRITLIVAVVVVLAACGGSDGSDSPAAPSSSNPDGGATTTQQQGSDTTAGSPSATDASPSGASFARVTVEGTTYEFEKSGPAATCNPDFFGGFFAVLYTEDLGQTFQIELWSSGSGEGRESTSSMNITTPDGVEYDLDAIPDKSWPTVEAGTSRVETFSYEGNRATGTGYYINNEVAFGTDGPYEPIIGEFEVVCGDD